MTHELGQSQVDIWVVWACQTRVHFYLPT